MQAYLILRNRGDKFLWKNEFDKIAYYIPSKYDKPTKQPNEQHFKAGGRGQRAQLNLERNYFRTCAVAAIVDDALDEVATAAETETTTQQPLTAAQGEGTPQPDTDALEEDRQPSDTFDMPDAIDTCMLEALTCPREG